VTKGGFSSAGLQALHDTIARHVENGPLPGLVLGVRRGDHTHLDAIGSISARGAPMPADARFRITSMTRPVTAVAALMLVDDGLLELDEPVDRLLPELADRQVLRRLDGPIDDTVPAQRPITVRDLLTMRGGFGMILAPPDAYPVLQAEAALELRSAGPPTPITPHAPDEWMRRMGTLPLMWQPGEQWAYATGSQILGVLVARASGAPVERFFADRIFGPLGMHDTSFVVTEADRDRFALCYQVDDDGSLVPYDDGDTWLHPRPFADCGGGLVSTVADYLAFGSMLANHGSHGGTRLVAPELVDAMTTNQLTAAQRAAAGPILRGRGWGFGVSIIDPPGDGTPGPKGYGWSGGFGTVWVNDPTEGLTAVCCTQVLLCGAVFALEADFWSRTYAALEG
jgi:CubicO group peptidase (beta-lactamase class C family)